MQAALPDYPLVLSLSLSSQDPNIVSCIHCESSCGNITNAFASVFLRESTTHKKVHKKKGKKRKGLKIGGGKKGCCPNELSFCGARAGTKTSICLFAAHFSSESCARILWALKSHSDPLLSMVDGIWLPSQIVEECGDQSLFSLSGHLASLQSCSRCCCSRREGG